MKTIPIGLLQHYASGSTTLARLVRVQRRDGAVYAFTDHDRPLTYGGLNYRPTSAFESSAIATRGELNVDNMDVVGVLDDAGITEADIEAGLWDGASVTIREVNWSSLGDGANVLRAGTIGQVQRHGGRYTAELRGLMQALQNNVGRVVLPACDAALGDARCTVDIEALAATGSVTAVTGRTQFADSSLAATAGYYTGGDVTFSTGLNAGVRIEVKDHDTGGALALQLPLPHDLTVGDDFTVRPGCDKTKATCIAKFSNLLNFRGFSFVPGPDQLGHFGGQ